MEKQTIGWGIIGCGDVTEKKSGPAFQQVEGSTIVSVMRRDAAKAKDYAERHGVPKWTADADELLNDPEVTAIYVATPPNTHMDYALRAMRAGKPVYIEKPMARTHAECQQVVEASRELRVPAYVAYYRRALPHFEAIRTLLVEGELGEILTVRMHLIAGAPPEDPMDSWRWQPEVAGGGLLWDLGSHQLDLMDWWFGPITRVHGIRRSRLGLEVEDVASATMEFASGPLLSAHWCFAADAGSRKDVIEVVGTKGHIRTACFGWSGFMYSRNGKQEVREFTMPGSIQYPLIEQIVGELRGIPGVKSPSTAETAARTNWVLEQIQAAG